MRGARSEGGQVVFKLEIESDIHRSELIGKVPEYKGQGNLATLGRLAHSAEDLLGDGESSFATRTCLELTVDVLATLLQDLTVQVRRQDASTLAAHIAFRVVGALHESVVETEGSSVGEQ